MSGSKIYGTLRHDVLSASRMKHCAGERVELVDPPLGKRTFCGVLFRKPGPIELIPFEAVEWESPVSLPREIASHRVNGCNESVYVFAEELPCRYSVHWNPKNIPGPIEPYVMIPFQNGPVSEVGTNGVTNEALLAIVIDRLQAFQRGSFSCRENAIALTKLEEAMLWLQKRTQERLSRGVEGTHKP